MKITKKKLKVLSIQQLASIPFLIAIGAIIKLNYKVDKKIEDRYDPETEETS